MAHMTVRELKLNDGIFHQAICITCSFAGPRQDTIEEAEDDAARHVTQPGKQNHRVRISTIETSVRVAKSSKK